MISRITDVGSSTNSGTSSWVATVASWFSRRKLAASPTVAAVIAFNNDTPLYIELPAAVVLEVTETEPGLQGDRSTGGTKPATVETGYEIQVPLFVEQGTKVKVDTRSGDYLGRIS